MDQEGEALGVGGDWSSLPAERDSPKPIRNHAGVVHRGKALLCTLVPVVDNCFWILVWGPPWVAWVLQSPLLVDPRGQGTEVGFFLSLGQVNGWDMTMVTHDQARKRLTKRSEEVVRLLVTRQSLQKAVQQSMLS